MERLRFRYSAIGLFRDARNSRAELRVVLVSASDIGNAAEKAEEMMNRYASDFELQYCNVLNVYEAGSDMVNAYGEIFSLTWASDPSFEESLLRKFDS